MSGHRQAPARLVFQPESVEKGFATLVLTIVELLRQLMERQAVRRIDEDDLSAEQIEALGSTLMALEEQMLRLCDHFGLTLADLNLDLGPLGPLLPRNTGDPDAVAREPPADRYGDITDSVGYVTSPLHRSP